MTDLLKSMLGGLARFVLAWLLPVALCVGLFWAVCIPALSHAESFSLLTGIGTNGRRGSVAALGIAAFATLTLATLLAYASQFIYRVLEGYHLPRPIDQSWTLRQRRRHARLVAIRSSLERRPRGTSSKQYGLVSEQLGLFPASENLIMPTRLGNALKTLEGYGQSRFGLDSQQLWYELLGTSLEAVRRDTEEARAQVDLFVASVAGFSLLTVAAAGVGLFTGEAGPLVLAGCSLFVVPLSYRGAVRNMKDWSNSVRALVNLGRVPLAAGLGLGLPQTLEDERRMWHAVSGAYIYDTEGWRPWLDVFRVGTDFRALEDGAPRFLPSDTVETP